MKTYKWIDRLIDKITLNNQNNNDCFTFFGHEIVLQSGTTDFMDVCIRKKSIELVRFDFDFLTMELHFDAYKDYKTRDSVISGFKKCYEKIKIIDDPWKEKKDELEQTLRNEDYDIRDYLKRQHKLFAKKAQTL